MKIKHIIFFLFCIVSLFTFSPQNNVYLDKEKGSELISLNSFNNNSWFRIWRGDTYSEGENIVLDSREDIIIHGRYGNGNIIVKYNNSGVELWDQTYGYTIFGSWEFRYGQDLAIDSENNIYLVGHVSGEYDWAGDCFIVKFNEIGKIQWELIWGYEQAEYGTQVAVDSEDNIYVAGNIINSVDVYDLFLLKYNQSGDIQWSQVWEGYGCELVTDMKIDDLNNIYLSGIINSSPNNYDMLLIKYNTSGVLQWNKTWGGDLGDYAIKIAFDSLDRITLLGSTESFGRREMIMKYNSSGILIWNKTLNEGFYSDFTLDSRDNFYFARTDEFYANESTDIYFAKYNDTGCFESDLIWGTNATDKLSEIVLDSSDNVYFVGDSGGNMLLVKNPDDKGEYFPPCLFTLSSNITSLKKNLVLYLNWTNSRGADNYSIYMDKKPIKDLDGIILIDDDLKNNNYYISNLSNGKFYYIVVAYNENGYTLSNYIYVVVNGNNKISFGLFFIIFNTIGITYVILSIIIKNKFK